VIAAAIAGAAMGSRLLFWLEDPALTLANWRNPIYLLAGKTVVGALVGGTIAVELTKQRLGITRRTGDLFAAPLALGIAIGRVGCFLSGLDDRTYGTASTLPWAVDFGDGIARHPVQLYEVTALACLAWCLTRLATRPHPEGALFRLFMVAYLGLRIALDALKPGVPLALGLTAIQWTSLAVVVWYAPDVIRWASSVTSANHPHATPPGAQA
jgi:prolipoprotein diacylglyceryltransferase